MPHITLLYPFAPPEAWPRLGACLRRACAEVRPFPLRLQRVGHFRHAGTGFSLWLAPEPGQDLQRLRRVLLGALPGYGDPSTQGFVPHLSLGQTARRATLSKLLGELEEAWEPLDFLVDEVCLIQRGDPPGDVFRVGRRLRLGEAPG
jgi:2'-5' RNA ligase